MTRSQPLAVLSLGLVLALAGCKSGGGAQPQPEPAASRPTDQPPPLPPLERDRPLHETRHLRTPAHLPETARDLVWEKMQGHGTDTTLLLWAVLFLDYEGAAELSRGLLAEPRFSRPIAPDDSTLNALLPPAFFDLQDELAAKAKALVEVAAKRERDGVALSKAYGELTSVCVRCHAAYLAD